MMRSEHKKVGKWPWLLIAVGGAFMVMTGWAVHRAALGTSPVTDPAYYSHGLKYNQSRIEARAAETLGWRVSSSLEDRKMTITLQAEDHKPVSGCLGELVIFNSEKRLSLALRENILGSYTVNIPGNLTGSLTGDLLLQRDGARINRRLLINL